MTAILTPSVATLSDPTSVAVSKDTREMVETVPVNLCVVLSVLYAVREVQSNLYITALYIAVTLCITVTEQLPKNHPLYLLLR